MESKKLFYFLKKNNIPIITERAKQNEGFETNQDNIKRKKGIRLQLGQIVTLVGLEVDGSTFAQVNFSLFILKSFQTCSVSFPWGLLYGMGKQNTGREFQSKQQFEEEK